MARIGLAATSMGLALLALGGCSNVTATRRMRGDFVGTDYAKLSGYLRTWKGVEETVPLGLPREIVLDEATLATSAPAEVCFDVAIRTAAEGDLPFGGLQATCKTDLGEAPVAAREEKVTVTDYRLEGGGKAVVVSRAPQAKYAAQGVAAPQADVFRVVERAGRLCCPMGMRESARLWMVNEKLQAKTAFSETFDWALFGP